VVAAPSLIQLGVPTIAAHLAVFYAACLSNITPPVCVSAFAGAAIAGAPPMQTGFAALKYGATLVLMPFSFVYVPELLLQGSWPQIVYATGLYATGCLLLAVAIQGTAPIGGRVSLLQRALFALGGTAFIFPATIWVDLAGLACALAAGLLLWLARRGQAGGDKAPAPPA